MELPLPKEIKKVIRTKAKKVNKTVGLFIKGKRQSHHYSQKELETELGIPRSTMSKYENNTRSLTITKLSMLAQIMDFCIIEPFIKEDEKKTVDCLVKLMLYDECGYKVLRRCRNIINRHNMSYTWQTDNIPYNCYMNMLDIMSQEKFTPFYKLFAMESYIIDIFGESHPEYTRNSVEFVLDSFTDSLDDDQKYMLDEIIQLVKFELDIR